MVDARDVVEVVGSAAAGAGAGAIAYRAWRNVSERTIMDGKPTTLQRVEAARLSADANTFQFKSGGDGAGVTDRLSGVTKWNPAAAGKVMVYEYADGRQVIADGHQRLGLAQRLMSEGHEPIKMDAIVLRQSDGWQPRDVRAYAAIKNMHESSGHSLDMARVMRERPDLVTGSLPISDAKIREAKSLARLSEPAFNMVASGTVKPDVAAAVGDAVKDSSRHLDYLNEMTKAKVASGQHARLYVQQAMAAPSLTETTGSLFGEETTTRSLLKERAQVLDKALTALKQDKRIFGLLEREAGTIEAVGNRLSHAANAERATGAGRLAEMVEKLSTTRGPISEMLDRAAAAIAKGEAPAKAARAFVKDVGDTMKRGGISALTGNVPGRMQAMADDGPKAKPVNPRRVEVRFGGDISGYVVDTESRTAKQIKRNRSTGGTFAQSVTNPKMLAKVLAKADEQVGKTVSPPPAAAAAARPVPPAVSRNIDRLEMLGWQGFRDAAKALNIDPSGSTPEIRARIEAASHQDWMGRLQQVTDQFEARAKSGHHAAIGDLMEKAGVPEGKRAEVTAAAIADFERQSAAAQKVMTKGRPGWSDEARAASADQRGVARPGEAKPERQYHLAAINDKTGRTEPLSVKPMTHDQAVTMKSKFSPSKDVRLLIVEADSPQAERLGFTSAAQSATTKSPGQLAYEQDVAAKPTYHDGGKRKSWAQLGEAEKGTWEKNPTPRFQHKQPESYWSHKAPPTPTVADLPPGAFAGTDKEFSSLSPGMRREIERAAERRNPQPASSFDSREAPKGQTSFIPPPTTKEKLTAAAASKGKPAIPQQPMDQGLFGSGMKQLDLVEMAKGKPQDASATKPADAAKVPTGPMTVAQMKAHMKEHGISSYMADTKAGMAAQIARHHAKVGLLDESRYTSPSPEAKARLSKAAEIEAAILGKNPGWQDAAREASAKERGVALPGQAKVPTGPMTLAQMKAHAKELGIKPRYPAVGQPGKDHYAVAIADHHGGVKPGERMMGPNYRDPGFEERVRRARRILETLDSKPKRSKSASPLTAAAQSAGVRDPNADMAKMFGPNLKPTAPTDQAAKSARADEFARRNFGKGETKPKRSKGSKALAMLGPVAIAGAAAVAFDATRSQAQAAGDSAAAANTKATGAAVAAGGAVAAVSWGIGKGLMLAAKGAGVVAPRAAALVLPGGAMFLAGMAAYGVTTAAAEGYKKGGVSGATTGALDWATMGAASHFGPRLTAAGASMFETANAAYRAMKPQADAQQSARTPGWGPEARIAAAAKQGKALPYGGNPENAPGYVPPQVVQPPKKER